MWSFVQTKHVISYQNKMDITKLMIQISDNHNTVEPVPVYSCVHKVQYFKGHRIPWGFPTIFCNNFLWLLNLCKTH